MGEAGTSASPSPTGCDDGETGGPTAALRARGAHRFDPVRFRYIEALARRATAHAGDARQTLERKLELVLAAYREGYEKARSEAADAVTRLANRFPEATEEFHRLHADGDFGGIRRLTARLEARCAGGLLAELVKDIDRHASAHGGGPSAIGAESAAQRVGPPTELKALRHFRSTWTQLSVDRQLTRSLAKAPENPGPLNSHLLVLRSLQRMQAVSPAYLMRFISHVDALLWLEQASFASAPETAKVVRQESDRRRKSGRGKPG
jgi:Protein of unknown function (DUF2894)